MRIVQTKDTLNEIYIDAVRIRHTVFVVEQHVPLEEEIDQYEAYCIHFVAYNDEKVAMGTCRLLPLDHGEAEIGSAELERVQIKLQRMAVLNEFRHLHVGVALITEAEDFARRQNFKEVILGAQLTAEGFYTSCGYTAYGDVFLDAGIEHIMMKKELTSEVKHTM